MKYLTHDAKLFCGHNGLVQIKPPMGRALTVKGVAILAAEDVVAAPVACPLKPPAKPCTHVKSILFGKASGIIVNGLTPLLESLQALTDGPSPVKVVPADSSMQTLDMFQPGAASQDSPAPPSDPSKPNWLELKLRDPAGKPIAFERFQVRLADGLMIEGTLDEHGAARIRGIDPGRCDVNFPDLDEGGWRPATA